MAHRENFFAPVSSVLRLPQLVPSSPIGTRINHLLPPPPTPPCAPFPPYTIQMKEKKSPYRAAASTKVLHMHSLQSFSASIHKHIPHPEAPHMLPSTPSVSFSLQGESDPLLPRPYSLSRRLLHSFARHFRPGVLLDWCYRPGRWQV